MIPELMSYFKVDASSVGLLSAFYMYSYAPMQFVSGLLIDRYGAKKLLTLAALIAGIGTILFGSSIIFFIAKMGRLLMGIGSSVAFIGFLYICAHWFPEKKRGLLIGVGNAIGLLGAVGGQAPLGYAARHFGWNTSMLYIGFFGILIAVFTFFVLARAPADVKKYKPENLSHALHGLKSVIRNKYSWINGLISFFFYSTINIFAGLWGITFLHTIYGLDKEISGLAASMVFLGNVVGCPLFGHLSDLYHHKKDLLRIGALLTLIVFFPVIYFKLPVFLVFILLFLVGFFSGSQLLTYSLAIDINHPIAKGSAAAFTNFMVFLGSAIYQPFTGLLLDMFWDGRMKDGAPVYPFVAYKYMFTTIIVSLILTIILTFFLASKRKNLLEKFISHWWKYS